MSEELRDAFIRNAPKIDEAYAFVRTSSQQAAADLALQVLQPYLDAAEARGYQRAITALRDTVANQSSFLWFRYGESGLNEVADYLESLAPKEET